MLSGGHTWFYQMIATSASASCYQHLVTSTSAIMWMYMHSWFCPNKSLQHQYGEDFYPPLFDVLSNMIVGGGGVFLSNCYQITGPWS